MEDLGPILRAELSAQILQNLGASPTLAAAGGRRDTRGSTKTSALVASSSGRRGGSGIPQAMIRAKPSSRVEEPCGEAAKGDLLQQQLEADESAVAGAAAESSDIEDGMGFGDIYGEDSSGEEED